MHSYWTPQCKLLRENAELIDVDRYVHLENINQIYKKLCMEAGVLHSKLTHVASSKSLPNMGKHENYENQYNDLQSGTLGSLKNLWTWYT